MLIGHTAERLRPEVYKEKAKGEKGKDEESLVELFGFSVCFLCLVSDRLPDPLAKASQRGASA